MMASGAVHFTGNLDPCFGQYSSSAMTRAKPKSQILAMLFSPIKTLRAAKSLQKNQKKKKFSINSFSIRSSSPDLIVPVYQLFGF